MTHLLNSDLQKFLMQQFLLEYPEFDKNVEYNLIFREDVRFNQKFENLFKDWLGIGTNFLTKEDCEELSKVPGLKPSYINWLRGYSPNFKNIIYNINRGILNLKIIGKWSNVIWFEVPVMSAISELYYKSNLDDDYEGIKILNICDHEKFNALGNAKVVEFGTRRRYSFENQKRILNIMRQYPCYSGTSNVLLALQNNEIPVGTMAHEMFMGIAPQVGYNKVYETFLNKWYKLYAPHYLTMLTDTFTSEHFFENTNDSLYYMYDGIRQDSGDEIEVIQKYFTRLNKAGLNDKNKRIIFSNSLNKQRILRIHKDWYGNIMNLSYGVGTNLTNDVGVNPLNMVIKLVEIDGKPTIKISDGTGKTMGPKEIISRILFGKDI